jgi:hypothetical protein
MVLLGALAAAPASAEDRQRGRERSDRRDQQREERTDGQRGRGREQAVARSRGVDRQTDVDRQRGGQYENQRGVDSRRHVDVQRQVEVQRHVQVQREYESRRNDSRRVYTRPSYSNRGYYGSRTVIVPRVIRPRIVTVVPYRPYVYRPRIGIGVYYGSGGYPYGYTPRGYYDPIPGRAYGGLRITDAPREAQVFADGYYVGIVNDFDGVFQHLNLEAGPHHIEVRLPGYDDEAVAFDVIIQPGRTVTFRADW